MLRLCGHAQYEIMEKTKNIAMKYALNNNYFSEDWLNPKCLQGIVCREKCIWGGKKALEREI